MRNREDIIVKLREYDLKEHSEIQDSFSLHYLHTSLDKFAQIVLNITKLVHHESKRKCEACNLKSVCDYKL